MKLTNQLTTGILAVGLMVSGSLATQAVAQTPDAIDNARSTAKSLQQKQANGSTTTLATAKPAPGAPAPAVKPAVIPGSKPTTVAMATAPAAKPAAAASSTNQSTNQAQNQGHNQLKKVNVLPGPDGVDIEITSSQAVTPRVSKLSSPARLLVELPETVVASATNKIPVGSGGVKGVRIGMDGKTPPTTSVVVDLDKAMAYDVTPGDAGQLILTLHAQGAAASVAKTQAQVKNEPAPAVKTAPVTAVAVKISTPAAKPVAAPPVIAMVQAPVVKPAAPASKPAGTKAVDVKVAVVKPADVKPVVAVAKADPMQAPAKQAAANAKEAKTASVTAEIAEKSAAIASASKEPKPEDKKWAMTGRRDPFFSPVVQQGGSGCSTGKKCLEINAINLRGVVKSDNGFIAVVTNNMNKAYFLRENDPVFNGYVVKITGDSVVFQETVQDKLGKSFTREVVKRISTPAV
jgi:Tfp pilus assembly protein PilP